MGSADKLHDAIVAVQQAGLTPNTWPEALARILALTGAWHGSLECYDFTHNTHRFWHGYGIAPEMIEDYLARCRIDTLAGGAMSPASGTFFPESHVVNETHRPRDPFYAATDYLNGTHMEDFAAGILAHDGQSETVLTLRKRPSENGVGTQDVDLLARLLPHIRQALAVSERLGDCEARAQTLADALDWLDHGNAILNENGDILHANAALCEIARANDGLRLTRDRRLWMPNAETRKQFKTAFARALRLHAGGTGPAPASFNIARPSGAPPYRAVLGPLLRNESTYHSVAAILFVSDPLKATRGGIDALCAMYGLTNAEAALALALLDGQSPVEFARKRGVSANTVYTHLKHLKAKTGGHKLPAVIQRLAAASAVEPRMRAASLVYPAPNGALRRAGDGYSYY